MLRSQVLRRLRVRLAVALTGIFVLRRGRRVDNRIVLVGDPLLGNLAAFSRYMRREHPEVEVAQLSLARAGRPAEGALDARRVLDMVRVARARAVVTPSGPQGLSAWLGRAYRPLFVDVWHGVGFKARISGAQQTFLDYDAHLVSSEYVAEYYRLAGARAVVTGYARMDDLHGVVEEAAERLVLFAPTWAAETTLSTSEVLRVLDQHALKHDYKVAYRPHGYSDPSDLAGLERVSLEGRSVSLEATDLLSRSSVLVTDWSSIATDFLPLGRPIIYLEGASPTNPGPLGTKDRPGPVVSSAQELVVALDSAILSPAIQLSVYSQARAGTVRRAWGDTLDGQSARRYYDALVALEEARDSPA